MREFRRLSDEIVSVPAWSHTAETQAGTGSISQYLNTNEDKMDRYYGRYNQFYLMLCVVSGPAEAKLPSLLQLFDEKT